VLIRTLPVVPEGPNVYSNALRVIPAPAEPNVTDVRTHRATLERVRVWCGWLNIWSLWDPSNTEVGKVSAPDLGYIAVVPRDLIRARIASGLTHKDLAKRLGMAEQQIQQYEAKDYESVSLARIAEIAKALQPAKSSNRRLAR